jgi:hypothetical protein
VADMCGWGIGDPLSRGEGSTFLDYGFIELGWVGGPMYLGFGLGG